MTMTTERNASSSVAGDFRPETRSLVWFFVLAFAISWAAWAIPILPTLCPMIAAVIVTATTAGRTGLRGLLSRMGRWRVALRWWLVALSPALLLMLTLGGLWLAGQGLPAPGGSAAQSSGAPVLGIAVVLLVITFVAGVGEEIGWRGYALERLQRRFSPLSATLILAPVWWLWHLQFFLTESRLTAGYAGYLLEVTCVAVILTWLYNRSGGSILLATVWHALYNFVSFTVPAAAITTLVIIQGVLLVALELRARRRGRPSVLAGSGRAASWPPHSPRVTPGTAHTASV